MAKRIFLLPLDKIKRKLHYTVMKLSNFYSASRLVIAPILYLLYFLPTWLPVISPKITILIIIPLFAFMEFTDFLDGHYARKFNQVSNFGKIFDPFTDVVANVTMLLCFMLDGVVYSPIFLIILYREFGIMFLRMKARGEGISIAAKKGGKTKTVFYIVALSVSLFYKLAKIYAFLPDLYQNYVFYFNQALYLVAVILSVGSFFDYLISYKKTMQTSS